ncbi:MAG TPA: glycosyltransferase, partial [Bacteroidia bacterium]|nr:glycosyltransferase [Bacteroidia bacterium]
SPSFLYLEYNEAPVYKKNNFWVGEMEKFCMQAADLIISPSNYLLSELKKRFVFNSENIHVVPNPYRVDQLPDFPSSEIIKNNELTFYGKLSPQKGSFKILELFKKRWDKGAKETFTMIGGQEIVFHPLKRTMGDILKERYSPYLSTGLLKLKNKIDPKDKATILAEKTIFIVPSIVDNLPYVVLELMSLGKILIVSKQGGQAETVQDGHCGFVFDYNKQHDFEQTLDKVLALSLEKRSELIKNAIKRIHDEYAFERIYTLKMELLKNIRSQHLSSSYFPFIRQSRPELPVTLKSKQVGNLLSVVIPYYNLGQYLDEAVSSVLNSTYKNVELIIINDGSTDEASIQKLNQYKGCENIRVLDKSNTGLADSRNVGATMAKGPFLAFLDADDSVDSNYYERAIAILKNYENVHFVGAWTQYMGNSNAIWPTFNPEPPLICVHNTINSSSLVYKTDAFLTGGRNDRSFKIGLEDYESVIALKASGYNGVAIPEILFKYRVRSNSMIKSVDGEIRKIYHQSIAEKHAALFSEFEEVISKLIKENGPPLSYDNSTLDELPFQNVPVIGRIIRKLIRIIKGKPKLKKMVLKLKKING